MGAFRDTPFEYRRGRDSWDPAWFTKGVHLLDREVCPGFCQKRSGFGAVIIWRRQTKRKYLPSRRSKTPKLLNLGMLFPVDYPPPLHRPESGSVSQYRLICRFSKVLSSFQNLSKTSLLKKQGKILGKAESRPDFIRGQTPTHSVAYEYFRASRHMFRTGNNRESEGKLRPRSLVYRHP